MVDWVVDLLHRVVGASRWVVDLRDDSMYYVLLLIVVWSLCSAKALLGLVVVQPGIVRIPCHAYIHPLACSSSVTWLGCMYHS